MTITARLEALVVQAALWVCRHLGPVRASNVCGGVARAIGPWLPVSKVAHRNLRLAMPELDEAGRRRIVREVWENLGRTAGEFPHVGSWRETASGPGYEIVGLEHVESLRGEGGPGIVVTAHMGNWEVLPVAAAQFGIRIASVYRPAANPLVDALVLAARHGDGLGLFPKGAAGARQTLQHLRAGGSVGLLVDQKMNDGVEARLFGLPAMTASAPAIMALRFRCPVVPVLAQRIAPARIRVVCEPPLPLPEAGDRAEAVLALTQAINDVLERWIRAEPGTWLWLHRRFPKSCYEGGV